LLAVLHFLSFFRAGKEPFQLFNVVQFMMYDVDFSGEVSVDETMHMLYARYGKARLEKEMKALFGDKLHNGNGTLTFLDYLKAVSVRVPRDPRLARKGVGMPV
jgi:Ca2+-binding EF-hand superfamily protein